MTIEKQCPECDKQFLARSTKQKFCDEHCKRTYHNRAYRERMGVKPRKPYGPRKPLDVKPKTVHSNLNPILDPILRAKWV